MKQATKHQTWYEYILPNATAFTDVFYMGIAVLGLAILSNITIPLQPVPITMQTFGIFLVAFFFGARKGALTILAWFLVAALGFGVLAEYKGGLAVFAGPTAGYLFGFLVAVYVVGRLIEQGYGRTTKSVFGCLLLGNAVIYVFGLPWLWYVFSDQSLWTILEWGLFPFVIGDGLKLLAAMGLFPLIWKAGKKVR